MGIHADDLYDLALLDECEIWDRAEHLRTYTDEGLMDLVKILGVDASEFLKSVYKYFKNYGKITDKQRNASIRNLAQYSETLIEMKLEEIAATQDCFKIGLEELF